MFSRSVSRTNVIRQALRNSKTCTVFPCARNFYLNKLNSDVFTSRIETVNSGLLVGNKDTTWRLQIMRKFSDYPPHIKVPLPALSPTMETGSIVSWDKKEGDKLNEGDLLAEIETDKATIGFETPEEGYLAKILVPAGAKNLPIGQIVCIIVQNEADVAKFKDFKDDSAGAAPKAAATPAAAPAPAPAAPAAPPTPGAAAKPAEGGRVLVSPMAKGLAEKRNIRLQGKGSGLFGSITSKDLDKLAASAPAGSAAAPSAASSAAPSPPARPAPGTSYVDIPVSGIRATIAKRLVEAKTQVPHYYISAKVNMDKINKFRSKINKMYEKKGVKVSINDFVIKATAQACKKVPEANSAWLGNVIRQYKNADVAVAVATSRGLITPIIFEANDKGLIEINREMKALAAKARDGKLQPHEFQGGTVTVSNLGMYNVSQFCAVINPPHSLIVAVGSTDDVLIPDDSEKGFKVSKIMYATISGDHRSIDGAVGAEWLKAFRECMEDPQMMIV